MPRKPDPDTKERILEAADRLFRRKGEPAVSLRMVAKAAGTTTATVYNRYRDRADLIRALGNRERLRFLQEIDTSGTLEDVCRQYLQFAVNHRHEYQLIYGRYWIDIFSSAPGEPVLDWAKETFAKRFGGQAADYDEVARWLRMQLHGAASLLVHAPKGPTAAQITHQCLRACDVLIASAGTPKKSR